MKERREGDPPCTHRYFGSLGIDRLSHWSIMQAMEDAWDAARSART